MTGKQAIARARQHAVKPYTIFDTLMEADDYFVVSFRDEENSEPAGGMTPLLFCVSKKTGFARAMFPPNPEDLAILNKAEEVEP